MNRLNQRNKRSKIFNYLKTNKTDIALLQETHLSNETEKNWQREWSGMSFWHTGRNHQTAEQAILLANNFRGKIQNILKDYPGRILSFVVNIDKQPFRIINIYGPNKPHNREHSYQSLTNYITNVSNIIWR